jgi:hypothetical protein
MNLADAWGDISYLPDTLDPPTTRDNEDYSELIISKQPELVEADGYIIGLKKR